MKKNYREIQKIQDQLLAWSFIQCTDPGLLKKVQIGFPECFSEGGDDSIPLSCIRLIVSMTDNAVEETTEKEIARIFDMPILHLAHPNVIATLQEEFEEAALPMTDELIRAWSFWKSSENAASTSSIMKDPLEYFEYEGHSYILLYVYAASEAKESAELYAIPANRVDELA